MEAPLVSMLLLAAGRGSRLRGAVPKAWLPLRGQTLVERCVVRLAQLVPAARREIVLSVHDDDRAQLLDPLWPRLRQLGVTAVVSGGATRQESMRNALAACDAQSQVVLVHDAARPFFSPAAAVEAIAQALAHGGALLAVPAPDTLKVVDGTRVVGTRPRDGVWAAQTPQVARRDALLQAMAAAERDGFAGTDDVSLLERIGVPVVVVASSASNLKITTPQDWDLAEAIAARQDAAAMDPTSLPRIGLGIDLHRLERGRRCVLGGVAIDSDVGPVGHSDGDAILHALADALLGAAGEPDLGTLFSDQDPKNAGRDSADFLRQALARVRAKNLRVLSIDVVVEAERPKLKPHRDAIRARLAALCGDLPLDRVNVKGKTGEGLDAIGRGEALRATAVVLLA
jgi:2-C-methyl-D-erythritol 4-phosphate cytidylyltransferase/2-C-methyl-D-erythritol 2,4-cyclodiphosphate synthase